MIGRSVLLFVLAFSACTKKGPETPAQHGKRIYLTSCIACHNSNPALAGAVGPDLKGSSLELIRSKVMTGKYPNGYPNPKRTTQSMGPLPHLEPEIEFLHAFLNSQDG